MDSAHKKLVDYDPQWEGLYEKEACKLKGIFGNYLVDIQHIGSTSIPGIKAKPIVDVAVLIERRSDAEKFIDDLKGIGYTCSAREVSTERHFFRKYGEENFHLSIAYKDQGGFWERQILFRDHLRNYPEARDEYQRVKEMAMQTDPTGVGAYISHKADFIYRILEKAGFPVNKRLNGS